MASRRRTVRRFSRRVLIHRLSFFGGGVVLLGAACKRQDPKSVPAPEAKRSPPNSGRAHAIFNQEQWATMSAACERIIPHDQDPGALEADVPVYIERMLRTPELVGMKNSFLAGTNALGKHAMKAFSKPFYELVPAQQDQVLTAFKDSSPGSDDANYFELLLILTLEGLLGDPSYGGNKDRVGWELIGFGTSEPPPNYDGIQQLHSHRRR